MRTTRVVLGFNLLRHVLYFSIFFLFWERGMFLLHKLFGQAQYPVHCNELFMVCVCRVLSTVLPKLMYEWMLLITSSLGWINEFGTLEALFGMVAFWDISRYANRWDLQSRKEFCIWALLLQSGMHGRLYTTLKVRPSSRRIESITIDCVTSNTVCKVCSPIQ